MQVPQRRRNCVVLDSPIYRNKEQINNRLYQNIYQNNHDKT